MPESGGSGARSLHVSECYRENARNNRMKMTAVKRANWRIKTLRLSNIAAVAVAAPRKELVGAWIPPRCSCFWDPADRLLFVAAFRLQLFGKPDPGLGHFWQKSLVR
jgi:hypothetical protein